MPSLFGINDFINVLNGFINNFCKCWSLLAGWDKPLEKLGCQILSSPSFNNFGDPILYDEWNPGALWLMNFPLHLALIKASNVNKHENYEALLLFPCPAEGFSANLENLFARLHHCCYFVMHLRVLLFCIYLARCLLNFHEFLQEIKPSAHALLPIRNEELIIQLTKHQPKWPIRMALY